VDLDRALVASRLLTGTAVLARPTWARTLWTERVGARGDVRALAVRDLALGGTLAVARSRPPAHRAALLAGVGADVLDLALCTDAYRRRRRPLALALAASAIGAIAVGTTLALRPDGGRR
jgi:hypothetical protein